MRRRQLRLLLFEVLKLRLLLPYRRLRRRGCAWRFRRVLRFLLLLLLPRPNHHLVVTAAGFPNPTISLLCRLQPFPLKSHFALGPRSTSPVEFFVNLDKLISCRLLQILPLLLYFPFPGLFRNRLISSHANCSLHSPPEDRIFPLLLLLLLLLILLLLLLILLVLLLIPLLLLLLILLLLILLVLLLLVVLLGTAGIAAAHSPKQSPLSSPT